MGKNRNKYLHLKKPLPSLPSHVIELIVSKCDHKTKSRFSIASNHFRQYIGDITPIHIKQQNYFLETLKNVCENPKISFFHFMMKSKNYNMIITDENNLDIYLYIINKNNDVTQKLTTRNYKKYRVVQNLKSLFKKHYNSYDVFFKEFFENLTRVNLTCGKQRPTIFTEWIEFLRKI